MGLTGAAAAPAGMSGMPGMQSMPMGGMQGGMQGMQMQGAAAHALPPAARPCLSSRSLRAKAGWAEAWAWEACPSAAGRGG